MISVEDECEYTTLIADLILQLSEIHDFKISFWIGDNVPVTANSKDNTFHFLQEGIRISGINIVAYVWYDTITMIKVEKI